MMMGNPWGAQTGMGYPQSIPLPQMVGPQTIGHQPIPAQPMMPPSMGQQYKTPLGAWNPGQPVSPGPVGDSPISTVVQSPLVNGASGYFQRALGKNESTMFIVLPLDPFDGPAHRLFSSTLLDGSLATKALLDQMEAYGIGVFAIPVKDKIVMQLSAPPEHEGLMANLAVRLLTQPMVEQSTFEKFKKDLRDEIQESQKMPQVRLADKLDKAMFGPTHPFALSGPEVLKQIEGTSLSDVTGLIQQVMARPDQFKVMMVSPNPIPNQLAVINQAFHQGGLYSKPVMPIVPMQKPVPGLIGKQPPVLEADETLERANISMTWRAPVLGDPDYLAHGILINYLTGRYGFFDALRTKRDLVYGVRPDESEHHGVATFGVRAEVDYDKVPEAIQAMDEVVQEVLKQPIREDQLNMLKKEYLLSLRDASQNAIGISAVNLGRVVKGQTPIHLSQLEARVQQISVADLQRAAQRFFNPQNNVQLLGLAAPQRILQQYFPQGK